IAASVIAVNCTFHSLCAPGPVLMRRACLNGWPVTSTSCDLAISICRPDSSKVESESPLKMIVPDCDGRVWPRTVATAPRSRKLTLKITKTYTTRMVLVSAKMLKILPRHNRSRLWILNQVHVNVAPLHGRHQRIIWRQTWVVSKALNMAIDH